MSDEELLQLVRDKLPEELSAEEIALLHERLPDNPALRDTLRAQLAFDEQLIRTLTQVRVPAGEVWRSAKTSRGHRPAATIALLVAACVLFSALTYIVLDSFELIGQHPREVAREAAPGPAANPSRGPEQSAAKSIAPEPAAPEEPLATAPLVAGEKKEGAAPSAVDSTAAARRTEPPATPPAPSSTTQHAPGISKWPELEPTAPRVPFAESAFQDIVTPPDGMTRDQLVRWLSPVPGEISRFTSSVLSDVSIAGFEGLVRLQSPWPADAVLRLAPFDHDGLAIHFWHENTGVSLYYFNNPKPAWAAYRTRRGQGQGQRRPSAHVLLATDNERYDRTLGGLVEIRLQDGSLVFSRGSIRLLTVPMPAPPTDVYFDRRAEFRAFSMYRGEPVPEEDATAGKSVLVESTPAGTKWTGQLPAGANVERSPEGSVVLTREKDAAACWAGFPLSRSGLYELIVQLDEATPATGIYLGDDSGKPQRIFGFRRDRKSGGLVLGALTPQSTDFETAADLGTQIVPYSGSGQWLRIVAGCGAIKCWIGGDGRHWGRPFDPILGVQDGFSHAGLMAFKDSAPGRIGLKHIEVRELSSLVDLADPRLLEKVPRELLRPSADFEAWCRDVLASQPAGVETPAWRVACAVRTLTQGRPGEMGNLILAGLLDDALDRDMPPADHLRILDEAAVVFDAWDLPQTGRLLQFYDRLGRRLAQRGDLHPFSLIERSLLAGPIWSFEPYPSLLSPLVRAELVALLYNAQWSDAVEFCRRLKFWNRPSRPDQSWPEHRVRTRRLVEWAELLAREALGERDAAVVAAASPVRWQHPVNAQLTKDDQNLLGELQAALAEEQYEEACRIVAAARPEQLSGLLPDRRDQNLYLALPQAVVSAMQERPEWRRTMIGRFTNLAQIRAQQSMAHQAVDELRLIAVQFSGTAAAADIHRWLGDRALVEGNFIGALAEYQTGRLMADAEHVGEFENRARLAGACLGRVVGSPATGPTTFEDRAIPPIEFEKLVTDLQAARAPAGGESARDSNRRGKLDSVVWQAQVQGEWKGGLEPPPDRDPGPVDWSARQIVCRPAGELMLVSNSRQIACYHLTAGKRLWTHGFPSVPANWPLLPLPPVLAGDRLFVRRPQPVGLGLVCLDSATGNERWATSPELLVYSDPLVIQGQLYALTSNSNPLDRIWQLDLTAFDPQTGEVNFKRPLLELSGSGDRVPSSQLVLAGTKLVGTIVGTVICCDLTGRAAWVRKQTCVPAAADSAAGEQVYGRPAVVGNRMVVMQPGVLDLACLDVDTGRQHWHMPIADGRRLLGCDDIHAYVETSRGIAAYSISDGRLAWMHAADQLLDACWLGDDDRLVYTRREPAGTDRIRPIMVWLDVRTGDETAVWPLSEFEDRLPQLGPLVRYGNRFWTLFGRGAPGGPRAICELLPTTDPAFPAHVDRQAVDRWTEPAADIPLRLLASRFLPEWSQLGGVDDPGNGFRAEFQSQHEVLAARAGPDHPLVFTREVALPAGSRRKLLIMAGHDTSEEWKLQVTAGGRVLLSKPVDAAAVRNNWGRWEVDLSEFAGQTVRVVVEQRAGDAPAWGYWKQLELTP
jgi:outer membrane protein assembly factor BamB